MGAFEQSYVPMDVRLMGDEGGQPSLSNLSDAQTKQSDEMLQKAAERDIRQAFQLMAKGINKLGGVISGIESDDFEIDFDQETGRSQWSLKPGVIEEAVEAATDLGIADKEYMVYARKADDDGGNPQYGFDFVRSVASAEE